MFSGVLPVNMNVLFFFGRSPDTVLGPEPLEGALMYGCLPGYGRGRYNTWSEV
jgi:hypothetical protein